MSFLKIAKKIANLLVNWSSTHEKERTKLPVTEMNEVLPL